MAQMARQTRLAEEALVLLDPVRVYQLFAQFQECQAGTAPRRDVVAEEMNDVGDRDQLTGRRGEMCGHALQQHEGMVVDQNDLPARTGEARRLGMELAKVGEVAGDKGGDGEIIPLPDQPG